MEKFIPYEKLSKKGSDPTAAGGGNREGSEWQRSARCKSALSDAASAGYRNRTKAQDRSGQTANLGRAEPRHQETHKQQGLQQKQSPELEA